QSVVAGGGRPSDFYAVDFADALLDDNSEPQTDPLFSFYTRDGSNNVTSIDPRPTVLNTSVQPGAPVAAAYRGAFDSEDLWILKWTALSDYGLLRPTAADTDGDGLSDDDENNIYGTNPNNPDTDGDGVGDGVEVANVALGFDPLVDDAATVLGSVYTESAILDLRTAAGVTVQKVGNTATLSVPVEKSDNLGGWDPAGNMTLDVDVTGLDQQFYRLNVQDAN
ncbi:thrombospondin type 3 repeat-containing protein, partial [Haloferula sp. A504]|uniref:thrombospondin type 3 repeat-containing protein n=1 Tax=Haloferula sp. A504 TaxID=3373601 RepID=UPI0031C76DE3|nr:thrombospondin type 3 repeat-containing protein [Verrucomicrobiaceae bacterium E54]